MSDVLINTTIPAPRQMQMALLSWQSWDYYESGPYPQHAFGPQQWQLEKGPRPTPLPYAQILINEGAEFIFRNGAPQFSVPDDPEADTLLQRIIRQNRLQSQWISLAENAGNHGAIAAKFSIDTNNKSCPVRISFLDVPQECRVWMDPHDQTRILMARLQYPYRDLTTGDWYYFREEWTEDCYVTYVPKRAGDSTIAHPMNLEGYTDTLGDAKDWVIAKQTENVIGLIPITIIRNKTSKGNPLGEGDCWRVFRIMDRLALTMHGEDQSNQQHSRPTAVAINAELENDDPLQLGELIKIKKTKGADGDADLKLLEPSGAAREYSHRSIDKWEELLYKAVGLSRVNPEAVTNSGNMTALAFMMTYGRTISTSDLKRENWGNSGMAVFFLNILTALQRLGGIKEVSKINEETVVSTEWPLYFEATSEDIQNVSDRTISQVEKGVLPIERGAERIARAEKVPPNEIKQLLEEIKAQRVAQVAIAAQAAAPAPTAEDDLDAGDAAALGTGM